MEQLFNLYTSTLASSYVSGSGVAVVTSAAGLPAAGTYTLTVLDAGTGAVIVVLRVASRVGTTLAVTAEGPDANAAAASVVKGGILSAASVSELLAEMVQVGALSTMPVSANKGAIFLATDSLIDKFVFNGSVWVPYLGNLVIAPPVIADFPTGVIGANATRTIWKNQGGAGGGVVLAGTSSNDNTDNAILQLAALPATPYTVRMRFNMTSFPLTKSEHVGMVLRNSGSGKFITFGPFYVGPAYPFGSTNLLVINQYNDEHSSPAGTVYAQSWISQLSKYGVFDLQISDDGTTRTYGVFADGQNPVSITESDTNFITADQFGFVVAPFDNVCQMSIVSVEVS